MRKHSEEMGKCHGPLRGKVKLLSPVEVSIGVQGYAKEGLEMGDNRRGTSEELSRGRSCMPTSEVEE